MTSAGLFVYGTLRRGQSNHPLIEHLVDRVLPECRVLGDLYELGIYSALATPGNRKIRGELMVASRLEELLRITDALEGDEYERVLVEVHQEPEGVSMGLAWVYRFAGDVTRLTPLAGE